MISENGNVFGIGLFQLMYRYHLQNLNLLSFQKDFQNTLYTILLYSIKTEQELLIIKKGKI